MADRTKYFPKAEFIGAEDVKEGQQLTIEKFEEIKTQIGLRPILRMKGFQKPFGLNATNFDFLVEKFGENENKWVGKRVKITVVRVNNPQTNKEQDGLRFA